jgi:hypothetical protein
MIRKLLSGALALAVALSVAYGEGAPQRPTEPGVVTAGGSTYGSPPPPPHPNV